VDQQHHQAQESIDALVAELQDTLGRLEQEQQQAGQLSAQLNALTTEGTATQKQVRWWQTVGWAGRASTP
jgi:ABC-type transporter Mla subunit MlaD